MSGNGTVRLLSAVVMVALLAGFLGCGGGASGGEESSNDSTAVAAEADTSSDAEDDNGNEGGTRRRREQTTSVDVARAFRGELVLPVVAEGTVRARHSAELKAEISGRLTGIAVEEGQQVRKGQLLAKLDDREYAASVEEARAKYFQALSLLAIEDEDISIPERPESLRVEVDHLKRLEREGTITREERLARETEMDLEALKQGYFRLDVVTARSGIAAARAALERALLDLERTEIRAPFSGIITGLELSTGEHLSIGQVVCTIVNNRDLEAAVGVLESDIGNVELGRPALLAVPALGDTFRVSVDVISPHFDRERRTCEVLLRLENPDGRVHPGMFVRAIIAGETLSDRLMVPREAILVRDGRPLLFKVEDGRAKWLYLRVGRENDYVAEIERVLQGGTLSPGDPVVVSDHLTLAHDAKVKIRRERPIRDPWVSSP